MQVWKCIIVDDETVDRLMVLSFAKRFPNLEVCGTFESADKALVFLENESVDILFLDIDMPGTNGLEFRKKTLDTPICVFISGHAEHAADSFEVDTLDFIVKPLKFDRFEKAMLRIEEFMEMKNKANLFEMSFGQDHITVKDGLKIIHIKLFEIFYLEALKDYTYVVTANKKHCIYSNIGTILKQSLFKDFIRIHRSFAIQKQFVERKTALKVYLNNGTELPIGRSFKDSLNVIL
jgi:two-component system, LytTR family, response regulator